MANTWGSLEWSAGTFGEQDSNGVTLTGFGLTVELSNEYVIDATVDFGWGRLAWNESVWGQGPDAAAQVTNTNLTLTAEVGSPTIDAVINVGWGNKGYGLVSWNTNQIDTNAEPTGIELQALSGTLGADGEINEGWGRVSWGENAWGIAGDVQVSGQQLNTSIDSVTTTADANTTPTGLQLDFENLGTVTFDIGATVQPTGIELQSELGEESITGNANIALTGIGLDIALSDVEAYNEVGWGRDGWGEEAWGGSGIWVTVELTGIELSIAQGDETARANADVDATALALEIAEGTVDPSPDATVVGIGLEASLAVGSVVEADADVVISNAASTEFTAQGNAALSTDQAKFGVSSLELDGTDDSVDSTTNLDLSSTDFTVDVWIRPNSVSGYKGIWQSGTSTTMQSYLLGNAVYWTVAPSTIITTAVTVNANEWTMLSYERQGNTHRIYKNGTLADTATTANKQDNGPFTIGKNGFGDFNGYIDELRVSGTARYTGSSFTEPTSEFSVDSSTLALLHFDGADGSTDIVNEVPLPIALGINQGTATLDANTLVDLTGIGLESAVGTVFAGGTSEIDVTGLGLTLSLGDENIQVWTQVDTGTSVSYTEVSTGVTVTWNDVDTAA